MTLYYKQPHSTTVYSSKGTYRKMDDKVYYTALPLSLTTLQLWRQIDLRFARRKKDLTEMKP